MKTFLTLSSQLLIAFLILVSSSLHSQSPLGIPYQAVMRNADGSVMASSALELTFMIHDGSANGTVVYQESHALTSNTQGLVSCVVGNGVVSQGNFANINRGSGAKFLQVIMGTTDLGTQQMMSVPYALNAASTNVTISTTGDTLSIGGSSVIVPGISAANPPALYTMGGGVSDIDGNFYPSIIINGQEWMQNNLNVTRYNNGDFIGFIQDSLIWSNSTEGAYAFFNGDSVYFQTYGKLYNWFATIDSRGLCPIGWHVPSNDEMIILELNLGGASMAGAKMKSTSQWSAPNTGANNASGFSGLAGGVVGLNGNIILLGEQGGWWTNSEALYTNSGVAWCRTLWYTDEMIHNDWDYQSNGYNVRCLRD